MPQTDDSKEDLCYLFTREEAAQLITEALDTTSCKPEPFVRLLLVLFDHAGDERLKDSIYLLIQAAYDGSSVHSTDLEKYLEMIRRGQSPARNLRMTAQIHEIRTDD